MQSKESIQRKRSKVSNTRQHSKIPFRLVKPKIFFSNGNCNGYGGKMEEKCDAITTAQERCVTGHKKLCHEQRGGIQ